ncbi:MAG TPA: hypothetical protein VFT77_15745 [Reyranella sp.]|nr:hypothetical protein [Reyranella sp.]
MGVVSFLKSRLVWPPELSTGCVFAMGDMPDEDLWRVCRIQPYSGIPHARIEQLATGITKTIAVSALVGDRTFKVIRPDSAGTTRINH